MMYKQKVLEHFQNPRNYGEIENPDGIGKVGNVICGDVMWLYIKLATDNQSREVIEEIKFKTFGCAAAIATSSIITELAKGKTVEEALEINKDKVNKSLGELPPVKVHCSLLAADALAEAIYDYLIKQGKEIPSKLQEKHERIQREKEIIEDKYGKWSKGGD